MEGEGGERGRGGGGEIRETPAVLSAPHPCLLNTLKTNRQPEQSL